MTDVQPLRLRAVLDEGIVDEPDAGNRITVQFITGTKPVRKYDYINDQRVNFYFTLDGANLEWANSGRMPFLNSHRSYDLDFVLGVVNDAERNGDAVTATVQLSGAEEFARIRQDVQAKILRNVSASYTFLPSDVQRISAVESETVEYLVTKWGVDEISLVVLGAHEDAMILADAKSQIARERASEAKLLEQLHAQFFMTKGTGTATPDGTAGLPAAAAPAPAPAAPAAPAPAPAAPAAPAPAPAAPAAPAPAPVAAAPAPVDTARLVQAGAKRERQRAGDIRQLGEALGLPAEAQKFIDDGTPEPEARQALLAKRQQQQLSQTGDNAVPAQPPDPMAAELDKKRPLLEATLLAAAGHGDWDGDHRQYQYHSVGMLASEFSNRTGLRDPATTVITASAQSTDLFPTALQNVVNKVLLGAYNETPSTFERLSTTRTVPNFKLVYDVDVMRKSNRLPRVPQGTEFPETSIVESGSSSRIYTYGDVITFTRQAMIDDDLGAFMNIVATQGEVVRNTLNEIFWDLILDSTTLFSAERRNLAVAGTMTDVSDTNYNRVGPPSIARFTQARLAMQTQRNIAGNRVTIQPTGLITGAGSQEYIDYLWMGTANGRQSINIGENAANPFLSWERLVEPYLDFKSKGAEWYVFSRGMRARPAAWWMGLRGNYGPRVDRHEPFRTEGVQFKVAVDTGFHIPDYRMWYKNPGSV